MNLHFDFSREVKQTRIRWSKRFSHIWGASSEVVPAVGSSALHSCQVLSWIWSSCHFAVWESRLQQSRWNSAITWRQCSPHCLKMGNRKLATGLMQVLKDLHTFRRNSLSLLLITVGVRLGVSALMVKYTYWQTLTCFKSRPPALKISYGSLRKPVFSWKSYLC